MSTEAAPSFYRFPVERLDPKTVLEQRIDAFTRALRSKPGWQRKLQDAAIVSKWKREARQQALAEDAVEFAMQVRSSCRGCNRQCGKTPKRRCVYTPQAFDQQLPSDLSAMY